MVKVIGICQVLVTCKSRDWTLIAQMNTDKKSEISEISKISVQFQNKSTQFPMKDEVAIALKIAKNSLHKPRTPL